MDFVNVLCLFTLCIISSGESLRSPSLNLEVKSYVFYGVDRAWNSAWNDEAQDSISLRFVVTV